jgi:hypothetical protein
MSEQQANSIAGERAEYERVRCPECLRGPGQACRARTTGWEVGPHKARIKLALETPKEKHV